MQTILAAGTGSRLRVSYCTKTLMKRLTKTKNWAVALKSLIVLHRTLQEGGFLFQDHLCYFSNGTRDYLNLSNFKDDSGPMAWALSSWVRRYARFLDERLICSRVLGSFLEAKGSAHVEKMPFLTTEELLEDIFALQALLQEVFVCEVDGIAADNDVVLGALRLVVRDSYSIHEEVECRIRELMERLDVLQLSEALQLLQVYRKASEQSGRLLEFCALCEDSGILKAPGTPRKLDFSDSDLKKVTDAIKTAAQQPAFKSLLHAGSLQDSHSRLSFRLPQKRYDTVLERSLSSSQLVGREFRASRAFATGDDQPARRQGVTAVQNAGRSLPSLHSAPHVFLTGPADEVSRRDGSGAVSSKAVIPMNGPQHRSNISSDPNESVSLEGRNRIFQTGAGNPELPSSLTLASTSPQSRVLMDGGQVHAIESPQDWERTLMASLAGLGPRGQNLHGSAGQLGIGLTAAPSALKDSQVHSISAPMSAGAWGQRATPISVPYSQQSLQIQQPGQHQPVAGPVWGSKSLFPDYFASIRPNYNGLADLRR